eukprot:CAMPEP_0184290222 /NCGR_PEP_ID=MMETSP1049-20130417/2561_1 /TAXON_ID=77928 /ORGANISM="Proteomonas sulcata, Strain CCMP704" /LENGTH=325 /DNA_ID=CAMNT_0026597341 /DNA_START=27 /DNA_END=1004 /DNA_ORIENTATION=-
MAATYLTEEMAYQKSKLKQLVLQAKETDKISVTVDEDDIRNKIEGLDGSTLSGPAYEVLLKILAALTGKLVQKHDQNYFLSVDRCGAVKCNIKSVNDGFLFPYARGLFFVSKFVFIPRKEIHYFQFGPGAARTFEIIVGTKSGEKHEFSMIDKQEHQRLLEYSKKLKLKSKEEAGPLPPAGSAVKEEEHEEEGDSTKQASQGETKVQAPGPATKAKVEEEEEEDDDDDDSEEEDEDFDPGADNSDDSDGYDAIEAMDADTMEEAAADDDDDEDEDDEEEEDDNDAGETGVATSSSKPQAAEEGDGEDTASEDEDEAPPAKKPRTD